MFVRREIPDDFAAIRDIYLQSFSTSAEADLVENLREDGDAVFPLVVVEDSKVVGHVMFSQMTGLFRALGLAPVAVLPECRNRGCGARLVSEGIQCAAKDKWQGIFVVGDPEYYRRFGFSVEMAEQFGSQYAGPHFMFLSLTSDGLPTGRTNVEYAQAFSRLD